MQSGACWVDMKEYEKGRSMYETAVQLDPASPVAVAGLASCLLALSKLYSEREAYGVAAKEVARGLKLVQDFPRKHLQPKVTRSVRIVDEQCLCRSFTSYWEILSFNAANRLHLNSYLS